MKRTVNALAQEDFEDFARVFSWVHDFDVALQKRVDAAMAGASTEESAEELARQRRIVRRFVRELVAALTIGDYVDTELDDDPIADQSAKRLAALVLEKVASSRDRRVPN